MNRKPTALIGFAAALLALLALGCATQSPPAPTPVETAAETWKAMEKQSQGHSPRGQFMLGEPPVVIHTPAEDLAAQRAAQRASQPSLPTMRMSLRMHNAEVVAVLQALSRAAGKSIVLSPGVTGTVNLNIVERPWDEIFTGILAANKLTYSFDGELIRVMAGADLQGNLELETIRRKTLAERTAALKEEPLTTSVAKVRFADAKQLQKTVEATLSKDKDGKPVGNVQVDELTNSLVVQSVATDISKVAKLLAKLDSPRAQIKLKAHIVETTKEVARDLGILWGGNYSGRVASGNNLGVGGGASVSSSGGTSSSLATVGTGTLGALGVGLPASGVTSSSTGMALALTFGKADGSILETQLQALQQEKKLNIISSPSIATMDNQKAYTEAGERVPYQSVTGTGTNITYSVNFQDAVLRLEITPHIIDDDFIRLSVLVQKDEVDTSRTVSGNPYIVKKKTETTLIARNGETVVISGLSKLRNQLNEAGVPGVMDVPGVGWLAKSQSKDDLKDEFMIFITPTVLADWKPGERQKSYEELERELQALRAANATAAQPQAQPAPQQRSAAPEPAPKPLVLAEPAPPAQPAAVQPAPAPQPAAQAPAQPAVQPAVQQAQPAAQPTRQASTTAKTARSARAAAQDQAAAAEDSLDEAALSRARAAKPTLGGRQ